MRLALRTVAEGCWARTAAAMRRFSGDRRGVTALEYGIIASILGLVLVTIFSSFGASLAKLFTGVGAKM